MPSHIAHARHLNRWKPCGMQHPGCAVIGADINGDGQVNVLDVNPFVELLLGKFSRLG
ncbi:hypothetical protein RAS1_42620 [Phycisphaerae bacterium RAS1]|nr:hypothetical protein RAS1_42620 [Phycisphaerae bacterium RAS1]